MNTIVETINAAGRAFVEFSLPMLIQSSVLILILLAVDAVLRRKVRAVFRYWIWLLVLVKLVLPPSLGSPVSVGTWFGDKLEVPTMLPFEPEPPSAEPSPLVSAILSAPDPMFRPPLAPPEAGGPAAPLPTVEASAPVRTPMVSLSWQGLTLLAWAAVSIALTLLLVQRAFFVRGLVGQAQEANRALLDALEDCRGRLGLRRRIGLRLSPNATSPAVCGLLHPTIMVPQSLAPRLHGHDLQAVLLHEMAHVKRGDLWINLAQTLLQIAYFYNPLLWLANAMIRRTREQAVDETVLVAMGETASQYPETLVNIAKLAFQRRPALSLRLIGVVESKSALTARIKHILARPLPKTASLGLLGLLCVLGLATVLLPMAKAPRSRESSDSISLDQEADSLACSFPDLDITSACPRVSRALLTEYHLARRAIDEAKGRLSEPLRGESQRTFAALSQVPGAFPVSLYAQRWLIVLDWVSGKMDGIAAAERMTALADDQNDVAQSHFTRAYAATILARDGCLDQAHDVFVGCSPAETPQWGWFASEMNRHFDRRVQDLAPDADPNVDEKATQTAKTPQDRQAGEARLLAAQTAYADYIEYELLPLAAKVVARGTADRHSLLERAQIVDSLQSLLVGHARSFSLGAAADAVETRFQRRIAPKILAAWLRSLELLDARRQAGEKKGHVEDIQARCAALNVPSDALGTWWQRIGSDAENAPLNVRGKWAGSGRMPFPSATNPSDFAVTLSNGVTVELLGVCEHPGEGKSWWRPDGDGLLAEVPYRTGRTTLIPSPGDVAYEFAVRLHRVPKQGLGNIMVIPSLGTLTGNIPSAATGRFIDGLSWAEVALPRGRQECSICCVVATGAWETSARIPVESLNGQGVTIRGVTFSSPADDPDMDATISVSCNIGDWLSRVVAVTAEGRVIGIPSVRDNRPPQTRIRQAIVQFPGLTLAEIEEFQFQRRPWRWVEFENVSLQPGHKTDVRISAASEDVGDAVPEGMVGTWRLENPEGDDQQMAVFPDGRVLVLYPDGHEDRTHYCNSFLTLGNHGCVRVQTILGANGTILQYLTGEKGDLFARRWRRVAAQPTAGAITREIVLPDVDHEAVMLDLATGQLVPTPQVEPPERLLETIKELGKGDLVLDQQSLILVRGATSKQAQEGPEGLVKVVRIDPPLPQIVTVATPEGGQYEIELLSIDNEACTLKYRPIGAQRSVSGGAPAEAKTATGPLEFRIAARVNDLSPDVIERFKQSLADGGGLALGGFVWFPLRPGTNGSPEMVSQERAGTTYVLLRNKPPQVILASQDWGLDEVYRTSDANGRPAIGLTLNDKGASLFHSITAANVGRPLAILVNGEVVWIPSIVSPLGRSAMIAGNFTEREVADMMAALRKGMEATRPPAKPGETTGVGEKLAIAQVQPPVAARADVTLTLGGDDPLGLFYNEHGLWFELDNRSADSVEIHPHPLDQDAGRKGEWGYVEVLAEDGNAVTYKWRDSPPSVHQILPRSRYKVQDFMKGMLLRESGPGVYKARLTLRVRNVRTDVAALVASNWHTFRVTPAGRWPDQAQGPYVELREAEAFASTCDYGHGSHDEAIQRLLALTEKYAGTKYALEAYFTAADQANTASNETGDLAYQAKRREYHREIVKRWPDVVNHPTIYARLHTHFGMPESEFIQSRRETYRWLLSITEEQKIASIRDYGAYTVQPSDEPTDENLRQSLLSLNQYISQTKQMLETTIPDIATDASKPEAGSENRKLASGEISWRVVDPDGKPVAGAQVALCSKDKGVIVRAGRLVPTSRTDKSSEIVQTDAEGRFSFASAPEEFHLIAAHDEGFAWVTSEEFRAGEDLRLEPWARIEGTLKTARGPGADERVDLLNYINNNAIDQNVRFDYQSQTDAAGRFVFTKVPPEWVEVGYLIRTGENTSTHTCRTPIHLLAGQTLQMVLGGQGRPVIGRFVPPADYKGPVHFGAGLRAFSTARPEMPQPDNHGQMTKRQRSQWRTQWLKTPEAKAYYDAMWHDLNRRHYAFRIQDDGSFRIEDVMPGQYEFAVWLEEQFTGQGRQEEIGGYSGTAEVPVMAQAYMEEPLNLGDLTLSMRSPPLHVGDVAPLFEARTLDGKDIRLADYRGKFVLLSFWQPVFHPELDRLKSLCKTYGTAGRLAIIEFAGNDTLQEVQKYIAEHQIEWPEIYFGEQWTDSIAKQYGLSGLPYILLVSPEGRIVATWLREEKLTNTVRDAIGNAPAAAPAGDSR